MRKLWEDANPNRIHGADIQVELPWWVDSKLICVRKDDHQVMEFNIMGTDATDVAKYILEHTDCWSISSVVGGIVSTVTMIYTK